MYLASVVGWSSVSQLQHAGVEVRAAMRSKRHIKGRGVHQDRVKEASSRLQDILRNCDRLKVSVEELAGLPGVTRLKRASRGHEVANLGLFLGVLGFGVLVSAVIMFFYCGYPKEACIKNNTQDVPIQTMRLGYLPLDSPGEEPTLYNDSEDGEDRGIRPQHLRLYQGR